jgi:hypothetical protein
MLFAVSTMANAATPVVYSLTPINLSNGWQVTGTITTDGSTGYLTPANVVDWNLKIVQTTDMVWTQMNSNNLNISGISSDGKKIYVSTSPDGINDGGALFVGRGGGRGQIPTNAVIADFTQLSVNLGYGIGGIAGWQDEIGGLNFVGLNQRDGTQYPAASVIAGQLTPRIFSVDVPILATSPTLMTMFGTITTDGTIGTLLPRNIVAWRITARNRDISHMTKLNSRVLGLAGVSTAGNFIRIDHIGGQLLIGAGGRRPTFVTIADFTDPSLPNGFANYYVGIYGVMGRKSPLVGSSATYYLAAKKLF